MFSFKWGGTYYRQINIKRYCLPEQNWKEILWFFFSWTFWGLLWEISWGDGSDSGASHSHCGPCQGSTTTGASEVMMHPYCLLGLLSLAPYSWKSWQFFQVQPWLQDQEFWKFLTWKYHEKPSLHMERDWAHTLLTLVVKKRRKKRAYFDFLIK